VPLFDEAFGCKLDVTPAYFGVAPANTLATIVVPRFNGTGRAYLIGIGGGSPIGELLYPYPDTLGQVVVQRHFLQGRADTTRWIIHIDPPVLDHISVATQVGYDSLNIDGHLYPIESPEVRAYFAPQEALPDMGTYVTLDRHRAKAVVP
jgi:hypothetical protein